MGFYQRYEDTRRKTLEVLSSDIDPRPGTVSRFPPGIDPAAFAAPDDSGSAINSDAFAALQGGTTDIAALSAATGTYAGRFASEPELSAGDRSQALGPATLARFAPSGLMPPQGLGEQAPREDEGCPDHSTPLLLSSLGGETPAAVSSNCGENDGAEDGRRVTPTLPSAPPRAPAPNGGTAPSPRGATPAPQAAPAPQGPPPPPPAETPPQSETPATPESDDATDPRTETGHREKGSALTGFIACGRQTLIELWELVTELLGLAGGGIAAAWESWGPGWWTDDEADEKFLQQIREIRAALEQNAREGMELLAALHTYYGDVLSSNSVFSALTRAILLVYTEEEWAAMAVRGRARAATLVAEFRKFMEEDPDYAVGYLVCQIGQMLLGGGALLRIVRSIRRGIPGGDRPDLDPPDRSETPETIIDDPDASGAPTPNGPARQAEGEVRPEFLAADDPDAVPLGGTPDNGGVPRHGQPGSYAGLTPEEMRRSGANPDQIAEAQSGQDLSAAGYHVEQLDRPGEPHPGKQPGDYGYDTPKGQRKEPDYRINGVIFDHMSPRSPAGMEDAISKKLQGQQARNFVVRIPGDQVMSDYLATLRGIGPRSYIGQRVVQVILIDSRTGRIATWRNPNVLQ